MLLAYHYNMETRSYQTYSVLYDLESVLQLSPLISEVASVETFGAAHIETFELEGEVYVAVSNYYDGFSHNISSAVYLIEQNNCIDQVSPTTYNFKLVQKVPTVGGICMRSWTLGTVRMIRSLLS